MKKMVFPLLFLLAAMTLPFSAQAAERVHSPQPTEAPTQPATEAPTEPAAEVKPGFEDTDSGNIPLLRDYIHGKTTELPEGFDLNADGVIDTFDMALMKQFKKQYTLEPKGSVHTGDATFYGGGYVGGCAMLDPVSTDYWIVAMNYYDWNNSQLAGAYLEVTGESGTIKMLVTDELPEGKKGDLDLYTDAFPLIAPVEKGRVPCSWHIIPRDTAADAPVTYRFKEGSTEFWAGVQVRNHKYPITRFEYLDADGNFVEIPRRNYNYFETRFLGAGPYTFRITDIYGNAMVDKNIPLIEPDVDQDGHIQFPD